MDNDVVKISKELKIILITVLQTGYFTRKQYEFACNELHILPALTKEQIDAFIEKL